MCLPFDDLSERTLGTGEHAGFTWEIVKNGRGYRCGYVRVFPGHPWFEKDYDDVGADAHGGLTFAQHGKACPTHGDEAEWWLGFDCAHAGDSPDPDLGGRNHFGASSLMREFLGDAGGRGGHVWSQDEVIAECHSLCEQAAAAARYFNLELSADDEDDYELDLCPDCGQEMLP